MATHAAESAPHRVDAGPSTDPSAFSRSGPASNEASGAAHEDIAAAAYYRAERRGFAPGYEVDDWLEAERELAATSLTQRRDTRH